GRATVPWPPMSVVAAPFVVVEPVDGLLRAVGHAPVRVADEEDAGHAGVGVELDVAVVHPRAGADVLTGDHLEAEGVTAVEVAVVDDLARVPRALEVARAGVGPAMGVQVEGVEHVAVADA